MQFLIKKCENLGLKHYNDPKTFIEHSSDIQDAYKNVKEYKPRRECKVLIVSDDMIVVKIGNKTFSPIVTELFIRRRKINISLIFITQPHFKAPKDVSKKLYILPYCENITILWKIVVVEP